MTDHAPRARHVTMRTVDATAAARGRAGKTGPRRRRPDPRTGRRWTALIALCKRSYPWTCHLCGQPIPRHVHRHHPLHYQADHIIPIDAAPWLAHDIHNLRPSHQRCNQARSNRPLTPALIAELTLRFAPRPKPALRFFEGNR